MITLGKKGDLAARRQAKAYLMTDEAVHKLFDTVAPRFGDRKGGYTRIVRTAWRKGDGAEKAFIDCSQRAGYRREAARSVPKCAPNAPKKTARRWNKAPRKPRRRRTRRQRVPRRQEKKE